MKSLIKIKIIFIKLYIYVFSHVVIIGKKIHIYYILNDGCEERKIRVSIEALLFLIFKTNDYYLNMCLKIFAQKYFFKKN